jgi:hypothetical protein
MESLPFHETAMKLWESGFGFDAVSDRQLADAKVDDRDVFLGGNRYRVVVVPGCRNMPPATLRKLVELARIGATVVVPRGLPADVPGLGDLEKQRAELKAARAVIESAQSIDRDDSGRLISIGSGRVILGGKLDAVMRGLTPVPVMNGEQMVQHGLRFVRRALPAGHDYFIANRGEKPVDRWVPLAVFASSAILMDPLDESRIGKAAMRSQVGTDIEVYLQLQPGESLIVRTFRRLDARAKPWRYTKPAGDPVAVAGAWKVQFTDGGPALPAAYETRELASWTARDDAEAQRFAGTARYTIEFDRPAGAADDWLLDLERVCESARVSVNGRAAGTLFCEPFRVAVGEYLRPGKNTLSIEVTNLAANRVHDLDRRKVNWKYFYDANLASHPDSRQRGVLDASNWPLRDSGLLGPVTLTPVKHLSPLQGSQP